MKGAECLLVLYSSRSSMDGRASLTGYSGYLTGFHELLSQPYIRCHTGL